MHTFLMRYMENPKELDLIRLIAAKAVRLAQKGIVKSIGDDCAILVPSPDKVLAVTTDTLVEGVHFDLSYFTPYQLGRKTAAVNISDLASMGAKPKWAFLNLAVKKGCSDGFWQAFLDGLLSRLQSTEAALVGGDTVSSHESLSITLTLIGEIKPQTAMMRSGAMPNDLIFCSHYLGDAGAGLKLLQQHHKPKNIHRHFHKLLRRHLDPEPRLGLGMALSKSGLVNACIDLSDGLATDLAHICKQSAVKAVVQKKLIPISRGLKMAAKEFSFLPIKLALSGGEDFELLWTAPHQNAQEIAKIAIKHMGHPPFILGNIISGTGEVLLADLHGRLQDISYQGYQHAF